MPTERIATDRYAALTGKVQERLYSALKFIDPQWASILIQSPYLLEGILQTAFKGPQRFGDFPLCPGSNDLKEGFLCWFPPGTTTDMMLRWLHSQNAEPASVKYLEYFEKQYQKSLVPTLRTPDPCQCIVALGTIRTDKSLRRNSVCCLTFNPAGQELKWVEIPRGNSWEDPTMIFLCHNTRVQETIFD